MSQLEEVELSLDELEAIRLADLDGHYHDGAAKEMGVSRATFGRILETARRKIAEALVRGKALKIGGGAMAWAGPRRFECETCHDEWSLPLGAGPSEVCPSCGSDAFRRTDPGPLAALAARPVRSPRPRSKR